MCYEIRNLKNLKNNLINKFKVKKNSDNYYKIKINIVLEIMIFLKNLKWDMVMNVIRKLSLVEFVCRMGLKRLGG